jgi:hypothetical protein
MQAPSVRYAAFYAVSRTSRRWWDLTAGHQLGFHPTDNADRYACRRLGAQPLDPQGRQGGTHASPTSTLKWIEPDRPRGAINLTLDENGLSVDDRR